MVEHPQPEIRQYDSAPQPLTVTYARRRMVMYHVSENELDAIAAAGNSLHFTFFGVCFGAFVSFLSVLLTTDISGPKTFATFVALTVASFIGIIVFGINGWRDYRDSRDKLTAIKAAENTAKGQHGSAADIPTSP